MRVAYPKVAQPIFCLVISSATPNISSRVCQRLYTGPGLRLAYQEKRLKPEHDRHLLSSRYKLWHQRAFCRSIEGEGERRGNFVLTRFIVRACRRSRPGCYRNSSFDSLYQVSQFCLTCSSSSPIACSARQHFHFDVGHIYCWVDILSEIGHCVGDSI